MIFFSFFTFLFDLGIFGFIQIKYFIVRLSESTSLAKIILFACTFRE